MDRAEGEIVDVEIGKLAVVAGYYNSLMLK